MAEPKADLTPRERLVCRILILIVKILKPYDFEHQFQDDFKGIQEALK